MADIGRDTASPVSDDYAGETSIFTGSVNWVQIDLGADAEDADHLITLAAQQRAGEPAQDFVIYGLICSTQTACTTFKKKVRSAKQTNRILSWI